MADIIEDVSEELEDGVDDLDVQTRLMKEREPVETNNSEVVEESHNEESLPAKFKGKSVDEIINSYVNLEQQYGRQGNELGELRKLADSLIQKNLKESSSQQAESLEKKILSDEDFFSDPVSAVRKVVEEALQPVRQNLNQSKVDSTLQRLQAKHPDIQEIVYDQAFQSWIMSSTPRQDMWIKASNGDFDYADELLNQYKLLNTSAVNKEREEKKVTKKEELDAASGVSEGSSRDAGALNKPMYKRSELIRLRMNDPQRYKELHNEIMQAYAEGRVR